MPQANLIEATPLLVVHVGVEEGRSRLKPPSLLGPRIITVFLVRTCEALAIFSIQPFINQFVRDVSIVGGDDRKVGYYVGLIGSLYYATMALTILHWNRISDYIGRKSVLLTGLLGSTLSLVCVGLSRTYWGLVVSRCVWGLLDGNIGVTKSIVGETTEGEVQARVFALTFVVYGAGGSIGSLIGGSLSDPYHRFPSLFRSNFWAQYPYFLPCLATASLVFGTFIYTACFFTEPFQKSSTSVEEGAMPESPEDGPVPLRQLMIYPILISIANYASMEFLNIAFVSLLPLFLAMPIEIGGVGFDPPLIGYTIGGHRAFISVFLGVFLANAINKFGERRVFIFSMVCYVGAFAMFPVVNISAKSFGIGFTVWASIFLMLLLSACAEMAYGSIFMIITSVAPNKRSLGTTNGLSQTTVSVSRTLAPALVTSLFSYYAERQILSGYGVYVVFFVVSCSAVVLASCLPRKTRRSRRE